MDCTHYGMYDSIVFHQVKREELCGPRIRFPLAFARWILGGLAGIIYVMVSRLILAFILCDNSILFIISLVSL